MAHGKDEEAANLAGALVSSVGLRPRLLRDEPVVPVRRRSDVSADAAFARLRPVDRAANARLVARAVRSLGRSESALRREVTEVFARQYGVPAIDVRAFEPRPDVSALIPRDVAVAHAVVPVSVDGAVLVVAIHDPSNLDLLDALACYTGFRIEVVVASLPDLDEAIARSYG